MTKRRSRGEGSIFFLPEKGLWVSKITLPDGRRKVKYGKRQGPLREYHHTALNQMRQGFLPKDDKITISDFLDNYMETVGKHYLRPRTVEMYSSLIKVHIKPTIGRVKISDLRPDHLQTLYDRNVSMK